MKLAAAALNTQKFPALLETQTSRECLGAHGRKARAGGCSPRRASLAAGQRRQALATATTASREDLASVSRGRTGAEAMGPRAAEVVGLVGTLAHDGPLSRTNGQPKATRRRRGRVNISATEPCQTGRRASFACQVRRALAVDCSRRRHLVPGWACSTDRKINSSREASTDAAPITRTAWHERRRDRSEPSCHPQSRLAGWLARRRPRNAAAVAGGPAPGRRIVEFSAMISGISKLPRECVRDVAHRSQSRRIPKSQILSMI